MPIPANKTELVSAIEDSYEKLFSVFDVISEEESSLVTMEGHKKGTLMSVKNLVSYLIGWGELVLKWHAIMSRGETPDFPEKGFKWNELGRLAQKFYDDYDDLSYADLLRRFEQTVKALLALIDAQTNEALYGCVWYKKYSLGRMIQFNTSSPYKNAYRRVRTWQKTQNNY